MACPSLEDLLRDGGDHAAGCEECRALLEAWKEVDGRLEAAFRDVMAPAGLAARARAQASLEAPLRKPSWAPEILDFIGWAAVLTLLAVMIPRFLPVVETVLARQQ